MNESIFRTVNWFISVSKEESLERLFKFNSQVYLVLEDFQNSGVKHLIETYSLGEDNKVNKRVGNWSLSNGLSKFDLRSEYINLINPFIDFQTTNHLNRRQDMMWMTLKTLYYSDKGYSEVLPPSEANNNPRLVNWEEHNW